MQVAELFSFAIINQVLATSPVIRGEQTDHRPDEESMSDLDLSRVVSQTRPIVQATAEAHLLARACQSVATRTSGYPQAQQFVKEDLLIVPTAQETIEVFEERATG
jgi:hypothetical protein